MRDQHEGVYSIGIVARLTGLHEQTIRQYERIGLIKPKRSEGGTRIFSEHDVSQLRAVAALTHDMGINLAGVEVILRMRDEHAKLLALAREMFNYMDAASRQRFESMLQGQEPGLVPMGEKGLAVSRRRQATTSRRKIEIEDGE